MEEQSPIDDELLRQVLADLDYLLKDWHEAIDDDTLRRSSTVISRLLIEGVLLIAADSVDIKYRVLAPRKYELPPSIDLKNIYFYQAGGGRHQGMETSGVMIVDKALKGADMRKFGSTHNRQHSEKHAIKLGTYLNQPSFIYKGQIIQRSAVIKYVPNKLGGRHYDTRRGETDLERKYVLLDEINSGLVVANKNAVYFELLSIGQTIANNRDTARLKKRIKARLSTI